MIRIICPHCGTTLDIPDAFAGQQGKCRCGKMVLVPIPAALPPVPVVDVCAEIQARLDEAERNSVSKKPPVVPDYGHEKTEWHRPALSAKNGCLGCFGLAMIGMVMLATCSIVLKPSPETLRKIEEEKQWGSPQAAYVYSQSFVQDRLKSPASAKFPFLDFQSAPTAEKGVYSVRGYCDSQNGFGATVRIEYICTMRCRNGQWSCEFMDIGQRK